MTKTKPKGANNRWQPVLSDGREEIAVSKIHDIARVLLTVDQHSETCDLMYGNIGIAIFLFHYWMWTGQEEAYDKAAEMMAQSFKSREKELVHIRTLHDVEPSVSTGLAGLGWGIGYLFEHDMAEGNVDEIMESCDAWIYKYMIYDLMQGKYDFLSSANGMAFYCLLKGGRFSKEYLVRFIEQEYRMFTNGGRQSDSTILTGLAGAFVVLNKIKNIKADIPLLSELEYTIYELSRQTEMETDYRNIGFTSNRLGLLIMDMVGNFGKDHAGDKLMEYGKECIAHQGETVNCGLAGGIFSMAHIYSRLYNFAGAKEYKDISAQLYLTALAGTDYTDERTGSRLWLTIDRGIYAMNHGLLSGIAGIGLSLLSAVSDQEPEWDECMLMN